MNIEDFFISKYEELERENSFLKEQLADANITDGKYGVFAEAVNKSAVTVTVNSYYYLFEATYAPSKVFKWKKNQLKELLDEGPDRYEELGLIDVGRINIIAKVSKVDLGSTKSKYVTSEFEDLYDVNSKDMLYNTADDLGVWFFDDALDELMQTAKYEVQKSIIKRIEEIEKQEALGEVVE